MPSMIKVAMINGHSSIMVFLCFPALVVLVVPLSVPFALTTWTSQYVRCRRDDWSVAIDARKLFLFDVPHMIPTMSCFVGGGALDTSGTNGSIVLPLPLFLTR